MEDLLLKFQRYYQFDLNLRCVYTNMDKHNFEGLTQNMTNMVSHLISYNYGDTTCIIDGKTIQLKSTEPLDCFFEVSHIANHQKIKLCLFNLIPYQNIYPILSVIYENISNFEYMVYPHIPLVALIKDNQMQNQLKAKANALKSPITWLYKKDYQSQNPIQYLAMTIFDFLKVNYPFVLE